MSVLKLKLYSARAVSTLVNLFETPGGSREIANRLINYLSEYPAGRHSFTTLSGITYSPQINIQIQDNETQASATLTGVAVIATNTVIINGVTFTAVASGATGNQFNIGLSDTLTMANLAAAINGSVSALIAGYVTASAATDVVTVSSAMFGNSGNQVTLSTTGGTITASSARLSGGSEDATAQTLYF